MSRQTNAKMMNGERMRERKGIFCYFPSEGRTVSRSATLPKRRSRESAGNAIPRHGALPDALNSYLDQGAHDGPVSEGVD